ncbi:MAG: hypothetical protein ACEQSR_14860 [Candidatus Methylacidiphilales bacterium]
MNNRSQLEICEKYSVSFFSSPEEFVVGVSLNVKSGLFPINGLRHPPEGNSTGWYIWAGEEFSTAEDFFVPLYVSHLINWCPDVIKFLGLPPGFRFLIGENNYEDVWEDESLLDA